MSFHTTYPHLSTSYIHPTPYKHHATLSKPCYTLSNHHIYPPAPVLHPKHPSTHSPSCPCPDSRRTRQRWRRSQPPDSPGWRRRWRTMTRCWTSTSSTATPECSRRSSTTTGKGEVRVRVRVMVGGYGWWVGYVEFAGDTRKCLCGWRGKKVPEWKMVFTRVYSFAFVSALRVLELCFSFEYFFPNGLKKRSVCELEASKQTLAVFLVFPYCRLILAALLSRTVIPVVAAGELSIIFLTKRQLFSWW